MNEELRQKKKELNELYWKKSDSSMTIRNFLGNSETVFKKRDSIKALKQIRAYLLKLDEECIFLDEQRRKVALEFRESCNHEVIITNPQYDLDTCVICKQYVSKEKRNDVWFVVDLENSNIISNEFHDAIDSLLDNNSFTFTNVEDILEDMQNRSNIKVYRRK